MKNKTLSLFILLCGFAFADTVVIKNAAGETLNNYFNVEVEVNRNNNRLTFWDDNFSTSFYNYPVEIIRDKKSKTNTYIITRQSMSFLPAKKEEPE